MIPMPIKHSQCQQNALHDSNVSRTTQLRHTSFIEYIVYCFTIMASVATKRRAENKPYKSIRRSENWREELPIRMLLLFSEC